MSSDKEKSPSLSARIGGILQTLFGIVLIIGISAAIYQNYEKGLVEEIVLDQAQNVVLRESKFYWGGSWFSKDHLTISPNGFLVSKNNLIWGSEIVQIPYSKVKKMVFITGYHAHKIILESEGNFFANKETFFLRDECNLDIIKEIIKAFCQNRFIIGEKKSILRSLVSQKK